MSTPPSLLLGSEEELQEFWIYKDSAGYFDLRNQKSSPSLVDPKLLAQYPRPDGDNLVIYFAEPSGDLLNIYDVSDPEQKAKLRRMVKKRGVIR